VVTAQDERLALAARYLTAWRAHEEADRRFYARQVDHYGADVVRTFDALADLVAIGVVAWQAKNPNFGKWPSYPVLADAEYGELTVLCQETQRAEEALHDVQAAVRAAMERDGCLPVAEIVLDDVMAWAGGDQETVEELAGAAACALTAAVTLRADGRA
jgi:hypothetical protein